MKIHAKAFLYFLIFTLIFNVLIYMIYFMVIRHLNHYEQVLQRFTRLNDVEYHVDTIVNRLNQYLSRGHQDDLTVLHGEIARLEQNMEHVGQERHPSVPGQYRMDNLQNLVSQFIAQVRSSIDAYRNKDVSAYTQNYMEASKISRFIVEFIRQSMSSDLWAYRQNIEMIGESKRLIRMMGQTTFFVSIILSLLFSLFIYTGISQPIRQLVNRCRKISSGDFDVSDIPIDRKDEIGILMNAYIVMGRNIEKLLREIKHQEEYKRLLQEMELKSLQNQINPHFLFNTLNVISRIAYMEQALKTEELMNSLSKLLRHSLKKPDSHVTLREELDHIRQYLHIQKTRFQDRFRIEWDVQEQCLDIPIPILTLQPLVENVFVHGIARMESGAVVTLQVVPRGANIIVRIGDNGEGMPEETVRQILTGGVKQQRETTGIGLRNVLRRLQIFYQREDILSIVSQPGQGTTVQLCLPRQAPQAAHRKPTVPSLSSPS